MAEQIEPKRNFAADPARPASVGRKKIANFDERAIGLRINRGTSNACTPRVPPAERPQRKLRNSTNELFDVGLAA
jgi:hypothetical protein